MRCTIIAPINTDISTLKRILAEFDIEYFDPRYNIKSAQAWSDRIAKGLREADFVVAVYSSTSQETSLELGMCFA